MEIKNGVMYHTDGYRWRYFMFISDDTVLNLTERFTQSDINSGIRVSKKNVVDDIEIYKPNIFEKRIIIESILKG